MMQDDDLEARVAVDLSSIDIGALERDVLEIQQRQRIEYAFRMQTAIYDPKALFIVMRYDCVFACDHCFFYSNPNSKEVLPDEMIDKAIDFAARNNMKGVLLSGGEPMLDPPKVFRAIQRAKAHGLSVHLQSTYLSDTPDIVEEHAQRLANLCLDEFVTSLSLYHQKTKPTSVSQDYLDYLVTIIEAVTRHGISVHIKNTWDVDNRDSESIDHSNDFAARLMKKGAEFVGEPYRPGEFVFFMHDKEIRLIEPSIISVGKAQAKGLVSQRPYEYPATLYKCPIFYEPHHEGGMLTIYPDGNVARCCSAGKKADFGFGNIFSDSFEDIIKNIRRSAYVNPRMYELLQEGHRMLEEEFPQLLPRNGPNQACEICSAIVTHPKARERLAERVGNPHLFTPYNRRNIER